MILAIDINIMSIWSYYIDNKFDKYSIMYIK